MTFDPTGKHQAQIPALQLLGPCASSPCPRLRPGTCGAAGLQNMVLDAILAEQITGINRFTHHGQLCGVDREDAHETVGRLKPTPAAGPGSQHG